jgi:hypothetical protein
MNVLGSVLSDTTTVTPTCLPTTTTTTTTTTTSPPPAPTKGVLCDPAAASSGFPGDAGCNAVCYCDRDVNGSARCTTVKGSDQACATDTECPGDDLCDAVYHPPKCKSSVGCTSTYSQTSRRASERELVNAFKRASARKRRLRK